jgi:hypothetical protein
MIKVVLLIGMIWPSTIDVKEDKKIAGWISSVSFLSVFELQYCTSMICDRSCFPEIIAII